MSLIAVATMLSYTILRVRFQFSQYVFGNDNALRVGFWAETRNLRQFSVGRAYFVPERAMLRKREVTATICSCILKVRTRLRTRMYSDHHANSFRGGDQV